MKGDKRNLADLLKDGEDSGVPDYIGTFPFTVKKHVCALEKVRLNGIERRKIVGGENKPKDDEAQLPIIHELKENEVWN
ncbi:unnamed protein product [Cylicocyclus nassatus]|uniref:Uncharacterized protein n=1 Tax=Cylicocyclus nassatus TaxID=53992 RepID=A0AA36M6B3_CYLNA|nr:unnamed protein product [Cylicocyclus nassatus]